MFKFDLGEVQKAAIGAIGALLLTTGMVAAAAGPAWAIENAPSHDAAGGTRA